MPSARSSSSPRRMQLTRILNSTEPKDEDVAASGNAPGAAPLVPGPSSPQDQEDAALLLSLQHSVRDTTLATATATGADAGLERSALLRHSMRTRSGNETEPAAAERPRLGDARPQRQADSVHQAMEEESESLATPLAQLRPPAPAAADASVTPKKRSPRVATTACEPEPAPKRARVTALAPPRASDRELEPATTETPPARGKKRRQAPGVSETAPVITDVPPLPFTAGPSDLNKPKTKATTKAKAKATTKAKAKAGQQQQQQETDGAGRVCEFCKKAVNLDVLMHCTACRRAYHAKCFVHAFRALLRPAVAVGEQMERLQLEAPERRGLIFRCASCRAAFVDFYESGGFLWDCDCPTCTQPDKLLGYRQRKLVQMMADMELERQRKKEDAEAKKQGKRGGGGGGGAAGRKTSGSASGSASAPRNARSSSRSRRVDSSGGDQPGPTSTSRNAMRQSAVQSPGAWTQEDAKTELRTAAEPEEEATTQQTADRGESKRAVKEEEKEAQVQDDGAEATADKDVGGQGAEAARAKAEQPTAKTVRQQEQQQSAGLTDAALVRAVRVRQDADRWCFPVACSKSASLQAAGVMKMGTYKWAPKRLGRVQCECCGRLYGGREFVAHTDGSLLAATRDAGDAGDSSDSSDSSGAPDPMTFVFVPHREPGASTPLRRFLQALRQWHHDGPTRVAAPLPDVLARLAPLALFKRPKSRGERKREAARGLADAPRLDFVAHVVCLPPKYVLEMQNGSLLDRTTAQPGGGDSFPRKTGWLSFSRAPTSGRHVLCACCATHHSLDDFVRHAEIPAHDKPPRAKPRQFLYVSERHDPAGLVAFGSFWPDVERAASENALDPVLDLLPELPAAAWPL